MEDKYIPIFVLTGIFGAIFAFGPFLVRKGPNRGIIRVCIMMSAFSIWIFWVTAYIAQMNPLAGPRLHNTTLAWIQYAFGNTVAGPHLRGVKKDDNVNVGIKGRPGGRPSEGPDFGPGGGSDEGSDSGPSGSPSGDYESNKGPDHTTDFVPGGETDIEIPDEAPPEIPDEMGKLMIEIFN